MGMDYCFLVLNFLIFNNMPTVNRDKRGLRQNFGAKRLAKYQVQTANEFGLSPSSSDEIVVKE